jgi:hypothetical protein
MHVHEIARFTLKVGVTECTSFISRCLSMFDMFALKKCYQTLRAIISGSNWTIQKEHPCKLRYSFCESNAKIGDSYRRKSGRSNFFVFA